MDISISRQQSVGGIARALGQRIRQLRQSRPEKLTQEELAERADISVSFLSMIERGERAPHIETLARIAEALDVELAELFSAPRGDGVGARRKRARA